MTDSPASAGSRMSTLAGPDVWPWPRWVAHRGAGLLAPENTLAAFRLGAAHGFRAFECDIKLSADDQPFLLHDATLERTTSGRGTAGDLPWAQLAALDAGSWHSRRYAGEAPPGLGAIAQFCLANGCALNLEIKPTPGQAVRTGQVVALAVRALWGPAVAAGRSTWPLLSSFDPQALDAARRAAPELPRALLADSLWTAALPADGVFAADVLAAALAQADLGPADPLATPADPPGAAAMPPARTLTWLAVARGLGCVACVLNHQLVDAALIERLHGLGLRALVYTVNDPARAAALLAWGLDGVITDAVDRMVPAG